MRTLLPDPPPAEFQALLERRRRWGGDRHDEVWEGVLHMNPAPHGRHAKLAAQLLVILASATLERELTPLTEFNLGEAGDYRVPDAGLIGPGQDRLYYPTAALVLEVVSPGDETWDKLLFYAAHGVDELVIVDPETRTVNWLGLRAREYQPLERSGVLDREVAEVVARIDWP